MRFEDWPARLHAYFAERERTPFAWGTNDCCVFAAGAVQALTGDDLLADTGPRWWTVGTAGPVLRRERGLLGAVQRRLGPALPTSALAQRGDVVLVRCHAGGAHPLRFLAVCDAERWAAPGPAGILRGPMADAVKAWRV